MENTTEEEPAAMDSGMPGLSRRGLAIETPAKAGRRGRVFTPRTKHRLSELRSRSEKYRKALNRLKGMKSLKKVSKQEALCNIREYVPKQFFNLLSAQVKLSSVSKRGRKWSDEVKHLALNLYFHGPIAYRLLSKVMELPTERSLRRWLSTIPMTPGIMTSVIHKLKDVAKDWPIQDRACSIMFDEISLKRHLQYDIKHDIVIGFQDDGTERSKDVGSTAPLMVLSSITKNGVPIDSTAC